jgi:hypothetical protein
MQYGPIEAPSPITAPSSIRAVGSILLFEWSSIKRHAKYECVAFSVG